MKGDHQPDNALMPLLRHPVARRHFLWNYCRRMFPGRRILHETFLEIETDQKSPQGEQAGGRDQHLHA